MSVADQTEEPHMASETALKISERYGVPPAEVDAIIMDRPVQPGTPHPMTMGALMKDTDKSKGSRMAQPQSRWNPATVVGTVLGILGILAIVTLLIFILRWDKEPKKAEVVAVKDTVFVAVASSLDTLPTIQDSDIEPAPMPTTKPIVRRRRTAAAPLLSTSNSLEAEERLAELKAGGNTKARIVRVNRRGTTLYQVRK
jgi:hypothetical protein